VIDQETGVRLIAPSDLHTKEWYSWINLMGSPYYEFHVIGEIEVPRYPETMPRLALRSLQGPNPEILFLELVFQRKPEISPRSLAWKAVRYDEATRNRTYTKVHVSYNGAAITDMPVEQVR